MTLNELASAIHNDISSGLRGKTDTIIPISQLEDEIVNKRNSLIKKYSLNGLIPIQDLIQSIECVSLECNDVANCCSGIKSGTKALRFTLPRLSTIYGKEAIQFIGSISRAEPFKVYYDSSFVYHTHKAYNKRPYVWVNMGSRVGDKGGFIYGYVFNTPYMEKLSMDIVAENPYDALTCCNDKDSMEFPAPKFIQDEIKSMVTEQFIRYYKAANPMMVMPVDSTSNRNA